jgi:hypothetical protein
VAFGTCQLLFYFEPEETGEIKFSITFAESTVTRNHRETVFETLGSKAEIIFPFWRALKEFASHSYEEPDWPPVDHVELEKLTVLASGE